MVAQRIDPATTLAIILGASAWPKAPGLPASTAFLNSARDFAAYLVERDDFGMAKENVLDLFDSAVSPSDQYEQISIFLTKRKAAISSTGRDAADLVLYYVGHGGFTGRDREYFLAVRSTREGGEGGSSIRIGDLAGTLLNDARELRRYLLLLSCSLHRVSIRSGPSRVATNRR